MDVFDVVQHEIAFAEIRFVHLLFECSDVVCEYYAEPGPLHGEAHQPDTGEELGNADF